MGKDYKGVLKKSEKEINLADHIFSMTYSMSKNKKVALRIFEHMKSALLNGIKAFLIREKKRNNVKIIPSNEKLILREFLKNYSSKFGISKKKKKGFEKIMKIGEAHEENYRELKREERYVIILPNYDTVSATEENIKKYLRFIKDFINEVKKEI